jgi:hypothetical protein
MPLAPFDANDFNLWYRSRHPDTGAVLSYERAAFDLNYIWGTAEPQALMDALGIPTGVRIALIGAGFGFLGERLAVLGYGPIANVETSPWIHTNKPLNATVEILNSDFRVTSGKRAIRQFLGLGNNTKVPWIITEDMLSCFTDSEITQFLPHLRELGTNIAHLVTISEGFLDPRLNWKTLAGYKALVTPDLVVARGSYEVL